MDLPTVAGMTPQERKAHIGPQMRKRSPGIKDWQAEALVWAAIIGLVLFFCWRPW
jgi:hypothetical protein